jgi:hypothetical protein
MTAPALSYILAAAGSFDDVRTSLVYVRRQSLHSIIEVVLVVEARRNFTVDADEMRDFHSYQVITVDEVLSLGDANAVGIRHANAPIVVLGEDHAFPQAGWAQAILETYQHHPHLAAVGVRIVNGNPGSMLSWADFLMGYGVWMQPPAQGDVRALPGHNSSYRRDILLEFGDSLSQWMNVEITLHAELRARGYELYLQPNAITHHLNFSRFSSWVRASYFNGRVYAAARAARWSSLKRAAYFFGAALIPWVRIQRALAQLRYTKEWDTLMPRILPALGLIFIISASGEAMGYLFGARGSTTALKNLEFRRIQHVRAADVALWDIRYDDRMSQRSTLDQ